jgi:hypothetical protein
MKEGTLSLSLYSKKDFFDYSLEGYSHRERWARTRRCFIMNNGGKDAKETLKISLLPSGGSFYQLKWNDPKIWHVRTVKQSCDI